MFQDTKDYIEQKVIISLLNQVEQDPSFTQRKLAGELGIALGLTNRYLKYCITKGWVRVTHISPKRIGYFLTPEGLVEKGKMVTGYLSRSLTFFRDARDQCEIAFGLCRQNKWNNIILLGDGDIADIAQLVAHSKDINVTIVPHAIMAPADAEVFAKLTDTHQAILITDMNNPQLTYDRACARVGADRVMVLDLLFITVSREVA